MEDDNRAMILMTDYSLWEVILNGDSPTPTRIVDSVVQVIAPTTAEQSIFAASSKATVSTLPNVDSLSDVVIYSFFASQSKSPHLDIESLKQIDADDLEEMDLKWQMAILAMRARRECRSPRDKRNTKAPRRTVPVEADEEPTNYALMTYASSGSSSSSGSDNEVALCSKACSKVYATLQSHYDKLTIYFRKSQFDVLSYKTGLESVEARLVVNKQNENVFEEDIKLLKLDVMLRDNALVKLRKKFKKAKNERDDLKRTLEKFQTSSKNLSKLLESQVSDKTGLGYDSQGFDRQVFDCKELPSHESDDSVHTSPVNDRYKSGEGYHVVPPPYTGTFMPYKPDLVFNAAPNASEIVTNMISDSEDETEIESMPKQKEPSFVPTSEHVKTPKTSVKEVEHPKPAENLKTVNQKSKGHKNSWNRKAYFVCKSLNHLIKDCDYYEKQMGNPQQALKNKGVIDSGCSRHMTGNISFLLDFKEFNGGYVAFRGNPKDGKISGKGKIKTGKLDYDDVYFVKELKFNLLSVSQMMKGIKREFSVARTPQQNRVAERKNRTLIKDARTMLADSLLPIPFWAEAVNTACYVQNRVLVTKPHNKTPYELLLGRSPSIGFMRPFGYHVTILNTLDPLGKFDEKADEGFCPFDTAVSPNFRIAGKSSFVDPSKYLDDPDMPELEDSIYSDDEEDVGVEADLSNLETNISVSHILITRVHKDHPVTQIIGYLTSAPQTRSMARMEPKKVHQALKDPSWIEAMQDELLQFKMQKELCKAFEKLIKDKFQMSSIGELTFFLGLQVKQKNYGIFISQDKYVAEILMKFGFTDVKSASTPIESEKPLLKDPNGEDVDVHIYMSMIGSLMYLTSSRPDIMFAFCTVVATSSTEAEYVAATSCCAQVLWIQNQLLDYSKELASPKQMALSKDYLNLFMAGSLPKTNWHFITIVSYKLMLSGLTMVVAVNLMLLEDVIRQDLYLDDADGVECLPNEEIFVELTGLGYEKPPPKLTFYKVFFSAQWKFLIHTLVQCVSAKRTAWNEFSCSMPSAVIFLAIGRKINFSKYIFDIMVRNVDSPSKFLLYPRFLQVIINNQVNDLSSHNTKYTSPALTQKVFANTRRVGKGFSGVETPLFALMIVQPQPQAQAAEVEEEVEVPTAPVPPSPTTSLLPPSQDPTPTPHASPPQEQLTTTSTFSMTLLNSLLETCATLRMHPNRGKIEAIDDGEDITLVDMETQVDMDAELQGSIDDDDAATKDANAAEPTVFDDEEEVEQAAARKKQEKNDLERAQVLQQQYDDKEKKINWNAVAEQVQERHLDNIRNSNLVEASKNVEEPQKKRVAEETLKPVEVSGMTYDKVRPIFEREYKKVQTLFKPDKDVEEPQKKRVAEKTLLQESFKKLEAVEVLGSESTQETPTNDPKEMSEEDVQNMLEIIPVSEFKVKALHVKHPIIDWEIHSEGSRSYWKIIRVGGITEAYQSFEDILKGFDREDLVALWRLVKETFSSAVPNVDKEKALWVELKRLFTQDADDVL
nr:retrovirus-related Pol polyprotein from transposon TNT 1-94 [Tanacetum cinerariifolium]